MVDESLPKCLQRSLREGGIRSAKAIENHLPTQVHHAKLDRLGVGRSDVSL